MMSKLVLQACLAVCVLAGTVAAQDTARVRPDSTAVSDSGHLTKVQNAAVRASALGFRSLMLVRGAERIVFGADSTVELWTRHDDPGSRLLRRAAPAAFWVPIAAVLTTPVVWADEAKDGNNLNAQYARSATAALGIGLIASRTAKHFIHRARPCTGESPGVVLVGTVPDSLPDCGKGSRVAGYTSFFSEHTVALFAIASAATFQAQRQNDRNAAPIAAIAFSGASLFSLGRIYQHQHWLSDVLVGAAVGTASGWLGAQLGPRAPRRVR